jgi:hypothetical protein
VAESLPHPLARLEACSNLLDCPITPINFTIAGRVCRRGDGNDPLVSPSFRNIARTLLQGKCHFRLSPVLSPLILPRPTTALEISFAMSTPTIPGNIATFRYPTPLATIFDWTSVGSTNCNFFPFGFDTLTVIVRSLSSLATILSEYQERIPGQTESVSERRICNCISDLLSIAYLKQ